MKYKKHKNFRYTCSRSGKNWWQDVIGNRWILIRANIDSGGRFWKTYLRSGLNVRA